MNFPMSMDRRYITSQIRVLRRKPRHRRIIRADFFELTSRKILPFYSASVTNLGSQMVASRCGYIPAWGDTFGTMLDGSSVYNEIVSDMRIL